MDKAHGLTASQLVISVFLLTQVSLAARKNPPADQTVMVKLPAPPKLKQIQGDDRILHALDRLTFGPRPGEVEEVKAIGLDAWIAQQHHPATIDDTALDQRLQQFPAMRLSEEDITHKFPPGSLSTVFLASNGNIGEVMRFLVQSPEFWSVTSYRAKIKTPEDFVISAVRAGGIDVQDANVVVKAIGDLGQPLYGRQTPDGYSMLSTPWVNSAALLERMNFSLVLAGNRLSKGVTVDWLSKLGAPSLVPELEERQIEDLLLHGHVSDNTRNLVLQQLGTTQQQAKPVVAAQQAHQTADHEASLIAGLLLGSPDFQRR